MADIRPDLWRGPSKTHFGPINAPEIDPPYRSVRHAIRAAYASEVACVWGRQPTVGCFGFGTDDDGVRRTPKSEREKVLAPGAAVARCKRAAYSPFATSWHEHIAEGAWTMSLIRDTLDDVLQAVLDARYTHAWLPPRDSDSKRWIPSDGRLLSRRLSAVGLMFSMVLRKGTYSAPDHDYVFAATCEWAGLGQANSKEWADHLNIHERTLKRWREGRGHYGVGIEDRLRVWLAEAEDTLEPAFVQRGLVVKKATPIWDNSYIHTRKRLAAWSGVLRLRERKNDGRENVKAAA